MKRLITLLILHSSLFTLHAQVWDSLCIDPHRIDTAHVGALRIEANALAFFQNNEFSSDLTKGYTLPGAWLQPKLIYTPIRQIQIEAGAHLLLFNGANRYPNYAYHDVAIWKGHQYQRGIHALPYFRAQADLKNLTIVLGDLYGAQHHQLILPLFNPEQNLSADPETGFQLLLDRKHVHLDIWLNWQSYIFNLDTHQEAFTVGGNATLHWNKDKSRRVQWESPIQVLIQHRGGEQDITNLGVQTLCNGAAGLRMTYRPRRSHVLNSLRAEANALGSWQQAGHLWPFDTGFGLHTAVSAVMLRGLSAEVGYVGIPRQFANLFGSPFFSTVSLRYPGMTFRGMHTLYTNKGYAYQFTRAYRLGAQIDLYNTNSKGHSEFTFAFGAYLRVCPNFVLMQKK